MKLALLALLAATSCNAAFAHSVVCVGPSLSYSLSSLDGGPSLAPSEQLFALGSLQISVIPYRNEDIRNATFALEGKRFAIGKPVRHDRYYVSTRYSQSAKVLDTAGQALFAGEVICHEETYDGPPIP